jgi:hypothetical protein
LIVCHVMPLIFVSIISKLYDDLLKTPNRQFCYEQAGND